VVRRAFAIINGVCFIVMKINYRIHTKTLSASVSAAPS
jgi:hypothetical protein